MPEAAISEGSSVLIVDDLSLRRELFVHFLKDWAAQEQVHVVSVRTNVAEDALAHCTWRMIIFNAGASLHSGADTLPTIRMLRSLAPSASLIVVADEEAPDGVVCALRCGIEGFLSNHLSADLVLHALSFVLRGGTYFPKAALDRLRGASELTKEIPLDNIGGSRPIGSYEPAKRSHSRLDDLSERQRAILERLCRGEPNKSIGRALNLPESTVKVHVREIMRKLAVSNRTQVAVVASRMSTDVVWRPQDNSQEVLRAALSPDPGSALVLTPTKAAMVPNLPDVAADLEPSTCSFGMFAVRKFALR